MVQAQQAPAVPVAQRPPPTVALVALAAMAPPPPALVEQLAQAAQAVPVAPAVQPATPVALAVQAVQVHASQQQHVLLEQPQPMVALNQTVAQVLQIQLLAYQLIMVLEAVALLLYIAVNVAAHITALAQVLVVQVLVVTVVPVQA